MRSALQKRIDHLFDGLKGELAAFIEFRLDMELSKLEEAFQVAMSAFASESHLPAAEPTPPPASHKPKKRIRERKYKPENYPPSRRAREQRTTPQANGAKPITCSKCGFVGGNARGCGRAHPTQGATATAPAPSPKKPELPSAPPTFSSGRDRFAAIEARARARTEGTPHGD